MADAPAAAPAPTPSVLLTPRPAVPAPRASVPKSGHRLVDDGDASPIGHPEGSDFEPRGQEPVPYHVTEVVKPSP